MAGAGVDLGLTGEGLVIRPNKLSDNVRGESPFANRLLRDQLVWLGNLDSNQDKQSQSLLCYRYTIPQ